ncbi:hypothetical protein LT493_00580 [Streptomyces tricolor]|nr:hypothetical protein [Streptomyces tricolor]
MTTASSRFALPGRCLVPRPGGRWPIGHAVRRRGRTTGPAQRRASAGPGGRLGVALRPHVKTAKSLETPPPSCTTRLPGPVTVSTLAEAEAFAAAPIARHHLRRRHRAAQARARHRPVASRRTVRVLLDSAGGRRSSPRRRGRARVALPPDRDRLRARGLGNPTPQGSPGSPASCTTRGCLDGVLTHAGESYFCGTTEARRTAARAERDAAVAAGRAAPRGRPARAHRLAWAPRRPPTPPTTSPGSPNSAPATTSSSTW